MTRRRSRSAVSHRPRRAADAVAGGDGEFAARYTQLLAKYRRLVERYEKDVSVRATATVLALAAMRASTAALAALRGGRFLVRNATWVRFARLPGPWRRAEPGAPSDQVGHATFEAMVLAQAAAMPRRHGAAHVRRYTRDDCDDAFDVRIEAVSLGGAPPIVLAMIADVTDWVRREREMARMRERITEHDRMRAIGELASGVAHDLNNTFHAVALRLSRIRAAESIDERERDLAVIERVIGNAVERVRRLQDLARRRQDRSNERLDLGVVVADAADMARTELARPGVAVALELDVPPLPAVLGSGAELRHVLVNLFLNARDAMPDGGRIRVTGWTAPDGSAEIAVEDDGRGIPPDHLPRLFDPFFTTKGAQGTGLGLAIARSVVDRMGGEIRASNRPEGGAAFTLSFPRAGPPADRSETSADGAAAPTREPARGGDGVQARRRRVLVVDDDPDNLDAMRLVIEQYGHEVEVADGGAAAVHLASSGRRFDVVFCDLGLRDADGWEVLSAIRAEQPQSRAYLVTGWAAEIAPDDPRRAGIADVLAKPLDVVQLRRALGGAAVAPRRAVREPPREPAAHAPVH